MPAKHPNRTLSWSKREYQPEQAAQKAAHLMQAGYHCSEAIFIAAGEYYLGSLSEEMIKMSTPFAGGIGGQRCDLCGALTGGLLVIGALRGRTSSGINDEDCQTLAAAYRNAFQNKFGALVCEDLRKGACTQLTRDATLLLIEVLGKSG